jgi:hypothetical protein
LTKSIPGRQPTHPVRQVQRHLTAKGLKLATGTIVDATIINAPSSTKNADKARGPEVAQWPDRQMRVLSQQLGLELQVRPRRRGDPDIALDPALFDRLGAKAPLPGSVAADGLDDG